MALANLVGLAIIITTAATLHRHGATEIVTSAQAAEALRPLAGPFAFAVFALGIIGTGLLAVPVLAGSAAYAMGEARKWPVGLARRPPQAKAFYATLAVATLGGIVINFLALEPMKALYWSAIVNGVVAVPMLSTTTLVASHAGVMGEFTIGRRIRIVGWIATIIMASSVIGMAMTALP